MYREVFEGAMVCLICPTATAAAVITGKLGGSASSLTTYTLLGTRQFGYSSAITNITLVLATTLTGYLAEVNWHLPFLVYLFPFISIFAKKDNYLY